MKIMENYRKRSRDNKAGELAYRAYLWAQETCTIADQAVVTNI